MGASHEDSEDTFILDQQWRGRTMHANEDKLTPQSTMKFFLMFSFRFALRHTDI